MGMRITIQTKGTESAPITIDLANKYIQRSEEMHGASLLATRTFSDFRDIKTDPKWGTIVLNAKQWMRSLNLIPCTKEDADNYINNRWDLKLDSKLGFNHKFFAADGVSFLCMRTSVSTLSAIIPFINLIGVPISLIKQLVKNKNCYLYFSCGKKPNGTELVWRGGAVVCAYIDRGSASEDLNK